MKRFVSFILVFSFALPLFFLPVSAAALTIEENWIITCNETGDGGEQLFFNQTDADRISFIPTVRSAQLDGILTINENITFLQIVIRYDKFTPIVLDAFTGRSDYSITYTYDVVEYENWMEYTITVNCPTGYNNYPVNLHVMLAGNCNQVGTVTTFYRPLVNYTSASGGSNNESIILDYWAWLSDSIVTLLNLLVDWWDDLKVDMLNYYNGIVAAISTEITRLSSDISGYISSWQNVWNNFCTQLLNSVRAIQSGLGVNANTDDDLKESLDSASDDAKEDLDVLDDVTMPPPDDLQTEINVDSLVDGNDVQMLANCISPILQGAVFLPVFLVCLVMSLSAYVLYGKR